MHLIGAPRAQPFDQFVLWAGSNVTPKAQPPGRVGDCPRGAGAARGRSKKMRLRVDLTRSPRRRGMTAPCAKRMTGIDRFVARTIARFCLTGKMAHDDLVCPATSSRLQSSSTPLALCPLHAKP